MKKFTTNMQPAVKFPRTTTAKLSELITPIYNRGIVDSHQHSMKTTILEKGFADVIKVFPKNKDGKYECAEGNTRIAALKAIYENTDVDVPIAIIDWIKADDIDEAQALVISLNTMGLPWTLYNYVKSHTMKFEKKGKKNTIFHEILLEMKKGATSKIHPNLTNSLVAGIYTKQRGGHDAIKDGTFKLKDEDRMYVKYLLHHMSELRARHSDVNTMFARNLIQTFWSHRNYIHLLQPNEPARYEAWMRVVNATLDTIDTSKLHGHTISEDGPEYTKWTNTTRDLTLRKLNLQ